ncbi:hypothetical protein IMCC3317_22270 [Kordia antarctica]|uniref:DUF2064 domain-containing protein n=1 Tax=Kordia antarctica TaxID=1218801 RepID=A0A7L4ZK69_9FLAO|nr:DUF2064 domain-containing protein [Kordia antarctica]QHI36857.1 hypothetical protein IMCC3317_22270 [Kordia antarctica]
MIPNGEKLFSYFNAQILEKVQKTGLPYFIYSEKEQHGTTFGARFTNAIAAVFAKGFTQLISVGNDTPSLEATDILKTHHDLQQNKVVIGPATDGGIYLLGISKEHFNATTFQELPWQTRHLRTAFQQSLLQEGLQIKLQRTLKDVDAQQDVSWFYKRLQYVSETFKNILLNIIQKIQSVNSFLTFDIATFYTKSLFNKGSPSLS